MKWIVVAAILFYQKFISPRKGFVCAYRVLYGGFSCSEAGRRAIAEKGVWKGTKSIGARFQSCREASAELRRNSLSAPRLDVDCSFGLGDSCSGPGGGRSCFGGSESGVSYGPRSSFTIGIGILGLLFLFICVCWFYGRQIESIDIKLIDQIAYTDRQKEVVDLDSKMPDYKVLVLAGGKEIKTVTRKKESAQDWISLSLNSSVYLSDIEKLSIMDDRLFKDKVIEVIAGPSIEGSGKFYEYKMRRKWNWLW